MTTAAVDLRTGDHVAAQDDDLEYEVAGIDTQNGRVQVADTMGEVHTYHRTDTVDVT